MYYTELLYNGHTLYMYLLTQLQKLALIVILTPKLRTTKLLSLVHIRWAYKLLSCELAGVLHYQIIPLQYDKSRCLSSDLKLS